MTSKTIKICETGGALLMNILVGAGIIAVLSTLTVPYLQKYQTSLKLSGVAKSMTSDLRLAQQLTIAEQVIYQMQFDTVSQQYSVIRTGTATTTIKSVSFPAGIEYYSITPSLDNKVVYNSFGGVSQSGTVILTNTDSKTATVHIKPSGYVQLQ